VLPALCACVPCSMQEAGVALNCGLGQEARPAVTRTASTSTSPPSQPGSKAGCLAKAAGRKGGSGHRWQVRLEKNQLGVELIEDMADLLHQLPRIVELNKHG
jgi:hypothetical protein